MHAVYETNVRERPRLAVLVALALLAIVTAMAAMLIRGKHAVELGQPVILREWAVSFRAPSGWRPGSLPELPSETTVSFHEHPKQRSGRVLVVRLADRESRKPIASVAEELRLRWAYPPLEQLFAGEPNRVQPARFGPYSGLWLEDDARGVIVAAAREDATDFAVGLIFGETPLSEQDRQIVRAVISSFERTR